MEQGGRAPVPSTARRLFFALWPDETLRQAIGDLAATLPTPRGTRLTRPERYHLTVLFLGDFDPLSEPVLAAIRSAAGSVRTPCFELPLDRLDCFEGSRVGWLGPRRVPAALANLHASLDTALRSAGVPLKPPTPYVPHVTVQRNVRTCPPAVDIPPLSWKARDFVLAQSIPGSAEPDRILGTWPLATH